MNKQNLKKFIKSLIKEVSDETPKHYSGIARDTMGRVNLDDINYEINVVESKLGDQYEDDCRENGATAYLVLESITEEEFNNSDKWESPTRKECKILLNPASGLNNWQDQYESQL